MTYKKLFSIEYNNKKFVIFIDESDRRTFLEINSKGEYEYPMLEDFIALHNMFNNKEPYICYDIQKFKFKECVKIVKNGVLSLLTIITILNSMPTAMAASNVEVQDDKVIINEEEPPWVRYCLESYKILDEYLKHTNLTKELILETIDKNNNLPENVKEIAKEQFIELYEKYPNANYGKFYLNMQRLECEVFTPEEYRKIGSKGAAAHYNIIEDKIYLQTNSTKDTIRHELAHTYQFLFFNNMEDTYIDICSYKHSALNEGLADKMAGSEKDSGSYKVSKEVAELLISISGFTFEEYMQHGIEYLVEKCKEVYPDIDFDYISATLDTLKNTVIYQDIKIEKDPIEMYDELFKIVLKRINVKTGYEPFTMFLNCLTDIKDKSLIDNYFERYNKELEKIGYFNTKQGQKIKENIKLYGQANDIIYSPENEFDLSLGIVNRTDYSMQIINANGTITDVKYCGALGLSNISKIKILISGENIKDNIINYLKSNSKVSSNIYSPIPININGKLLTTTMIGNLSIQLGLTTNKNLGFIISSKNGDIIYKSDEKLDNLSNAQPLGNYLLSYLDGLYKEIELSEVLNEDYLRKVQEEKDLFNNIEVIDGKLKIKELETSKQDNQEPESEIKNIIEDNSISEIYMNNEIIAKANVKDLFLTISKTKDGKIGYILTNRAGMPIYESENELQELSIPINFAIYTGLGFSKMHLEDYLNEDYLRNFQKETGMFNNIELVGDKIVIDASPTITIQSTVNDKIINSTYKLSKLKVYVKNGAITISSISSISGTYDIIIAVEDILRYSNILNEGIPQYRITMEELMEMTESYLNSLNNELKEGVKRK